MSATVFTGKFNYYPYASNENFFLVLVDGWTERGQVLIFSTFTLNGSGISNAPFDLTTSYVLLAQDQFLDTFIIDDLDKKLYYWFNGTRNADGTITLDLQTGGSGTLTTIVLSPLT